MIISKCSYSTQISSGIVLEPWPTHWTRKPWRPRSSLLVLSTEPRLHRNASHLCLSNLRECRKHLRLSFCQSYLLCTDQLLRYWGTVPRNNPFHSQVENGWYHGAPPWLCSPWNRIGDDGSEGSWCCKGISVFLFHAWGRRVRVCPRPRVLQEFHWSWSRQWIMGLWTGLWQRRAQNHVRCTHRVHRPSRPSITSFQDQTPIPREINFTNTLDVFKAFYLNKYIDYHAFETLS